MDPTDVMSKRIPAFLIDFAILAAVLLVAGLSFGFTETTQLIEAETICDARSSGFCLPSIEGAYTVEHRGWITLTVVPVLWLLWAILEGVTGASPGKWMMGLRVVTQDGTLAGLGRSLVRWTIGLIESFPWVTPMMVGVLFAANAPGRQRLGDRIAKTFVIAKDAVGTPLPAPDSMSPVRAWPVTPAATQPPPPRAADAVSQSPRPLRVSDVVSTAPPPPRAEQIHELPMPAGVRWDESAGYYIFEDADRRLWWNVAGNEWLPLP